MKIGQQRGVSNHVEESYRSEEHVPNFPNNDASVDHLLQNVHRVDSIVCDPEYVVRERVFEGLAPVGNGANGVDEEQQASEEDYSEDEDSESNYVGEDNEEQEVGNGQAPQQSKRGPKKEIKDSQLESGNP